MKILGKERGRFAVLRVEPLEARFAPAFTATLGAAGAPANTWAGDDAGDTLVFSVDDRGNLMHNRFSAGDRGFASDIDLDSTAPGVQSIQVGQLTMVNVNAGAGDNVVQLGTDTVPASALTPPFMLDGGGGLDTFKVNDSADTLSREITLTSAAVAAGGGAWSYANFHAVSLHGGTGDDTIRVLGTAAGSEAFIDGRGGSDTVSVTFGGTLFGRVMLDDSGAGTANTDLVTLLGTQGADSFLFAQRNVASGVESVEFSPNQGFEALTLEAQGGNDTVSYGTLSTGPWLGTKRTTLLGGEGADDFTFMASDASEVLAIDGQGGGDRYNWPCCGGNAFVTLIDSGAKNDGTDSIMIGGSDQADSFLIGLLNVQRDRETLMLPGPGNFESIGVDSGLGNDQITFPHTPTSIPATVLGGDGDDTLTVFATTAALTFNGQQGSDTISTQFGALGPIDLFDTGTAGTDRLFIAGTPGPDDFTIGGGKVSTSTEQISFAPSVFELLAVDGGADNDTMFYGTGVYAPAFLAGGFGDDSFIVTQTDAGIPLTLDGGPGSDGYQMNLPLISGKVTLFDHDFEPPVMEPIPGNQLPDTLTILGSDAADTILATDRRVTHDDHVVDFTGIEEMQILAGKGDDNVSFSNGALLPAVQKVSIFGGDGNDTIRDSSGPGHGHGLAAERAVIAIILEGDEGNDLLTGGAFANTIGGSAGDDVIDGGLGDDFLSGGLGANTVGGAGGHDTVSESGDFDFAVTNGQIQATGGGTDKLRSIEGAQITGGATANRIDASHSSFANTIGGAGGDDVLLGGSGPDVLIGGADNDMLDGGSGRNKVIETGDVDFTLIGSAQASHRGKQVSGTLDGLGHDILTRIADVTLIGGDSANVLDAAAWRGPVTLRGMGGDDQLLGGFADDILSGGLGSNTVGGAAGIDTVIEEGDADFTITDRSLDGLGHDVLTGIEMINVTGGVSDNTINAISCVTSRVVLDGAGGHDHLLGGALADLLIGGDGNDKLEGGAGNDVLLGGAGDDVLIGGPGRDRLDGGPGKNTITQ